MRRSLARVPARAIRGLGQGATLPDVSGLPAAGDLQGQLAQGQNLLSNAQAAINGGNPTAIANLLQAGITTAVGQTTTTIGTLVRAITTIGAATAVGAAGGPWGAAAGAIVSSIEVAIQAIFGAAPGGNVTYNPGQPTQGAQRLYALQTQWCSMASHMGAESGNCMGWSFYDYISRESPPSNVSKDNQGTLWGEVVANVAGSQSNEYTIRQIVDSDPQTDVANMLGVPGTGADSSLPAAYMKVVKPLCTPIFFQWGEPTLIQFCENNQFFGSSTLTSADRLSNWQNDTTSIIYNGQQLSQSQIMAYALSRRPPSMFFASDLYVTQTSGRNQIFGNCETMTGVASWLGILAAGGSIQSVVNELFLQQKFLNDLDGSVPSLFRLLVERALSMAQAERNAAGIAPPGLSTASKVGAVAAGAGAALLAGVLVYSAVNRISPVTTVELAVARTRRLF
jgi:hypothetical protein